MNMQSEVDRMLRSRDGCGCPPDAYGVLHHDGCIYRGIRARTSAGPNEITVIAAIHLFDLSPREQEVAGLLRFSNKEIAARLSNSTQTIKNHVTHLLLKTGTDNRTACALRLAGVT